MNTPIKLFPSALGLLVGLWMIACGGSSVSVFKSEKPGLQKTGLQTQRLGKPVSASLLQKIFRTKSGHSANDSLFAFGANQNESPCDKWFIESYK